MLTCFAGRPDRLLPVRYARGDLCEWFEEPVSASWACIDSSRNQSNSETVSWLFMRTVGGGDGELLGDDDVGEEDEEEAGDEADVEVPLRPAHHPLPRHLRVVAAHRPLAASPLLSSLSIYLSANLQFFS